MNYNPPNPEVVAQLLHAFIAIAVVFGVVLLGRPWWWGAILGVGFGALKEATYDQWVEHQPLLGCLEDVFFYIVGAFIAWLFLFLLVF